MEVNIYTSFVKLEDLNQQIINFLVESCICGMYSDDRFNKHQIYPFYIKTNTHDYDTLYHSGGIGIFCGG